jgi:CHAT domain-containing protein
MRSLNFQALPGTREEVVAVHKTLGEKNADLYTGKKALEEVLFDAASPRILHLATHGFFLGDQELNLKPDDVSRGIAITSTSAAEESAEKMENPLIRSGIALAGANNAVKNEGLSTGIVTAAKILNLRLRGTEMVVLSACETGLGEIKSGEGVFGLRRAFTQAGARSLVMSMWSVPDRETKELMIEFYKNIKSGKMNRSLSLRQAALKQLATVKGRYGNPDPFYWGAFVFMGEP